MRTLRLKRQVSAWLALAVFVPMLVLASLHSHPERGVGSITSCTYCIDHVTHHGHLSSATPGLDNCVLCQFFALTFVAATAAILVRLLQGGWSVVAHASVWCPQTAGGLCQGRAPPVGF